MGYNNRKVGAFYEEKAAAYLMKKGYRILERNYRIASGEIDLIALDHATLVFIEVKYRTNAGHGAPEAAVTYSKQRQISKVAMYYMKKERYSFDRTSVRFDVVAFDRDELHHIENAFFAIF